MKYLEAIAQHLYQTLGNDIALFRFVFPNRRAGLFFREYLRRQIPAGSPLFEPAICTCNELFNHFSGTPIEDHSGLLMRLYRCHQQLFPEETFDTFLYFGEIILSDFNDIDHYLVDAQAIYANQQELENLTADDNLTEEQWKAVSRFWEIGGKGMEKPTQAKFFQTWRKMSQLYQNFRQNLSEAGLCYEGMQHREVAEKSDLPLEEKGIVFIGFNAIDQAQRLMFKRLQERGVADFYWDYDAPFMQDEQGRAGTYAQRNQKEFPTRQPLPDHLRSQLTPTSPLEVNSYSVPSSVGQAQWVHELLRKDATQWTEHDKAIDYSAVVLADEELLLPVLSALPEEITRLNVTMGYPLKSTPVRFLLSACASLQQNRNDDGFYYQDVLEVLQHPIIQAWEPTASDRVQEITSGNLLRVAPEWFKSSEQLQTLFLPQAPDQVAGWMQTLLSRLEESPEGILSDMDREFIFRTHAGLTRLSDLLQEYQIEVGYDTLSRLIRQLLGKATVPFEGDPLGGLQVMGMLETRCLDFDRIIITSLNEGIFPKSELGVSFIPYQLRKPFGLPTTEHQDAIFAYHFYRLIARAGHVSILFDNRTDSERQQSGEESRFLKQLQYLYPREVKLVRHTLTYNTDPQQTERLCVEKTPEVLQSILDYLTQHPLSASSLNECGKCRLKFYLHHVVGLQEPDEVHENPQSNQMGNVLHNTMKQLYDPLAGQVLQKADLESVMNDKTHIRQLMEQNYRKEILHNTTIPIRGVHTIYLKLLEAYVRHILLYDATRTPFRYMGGEKPIQAEWELPASERHEALALRFYGRPDRLDEKNDILQIIDYKTGSGKGKDKTRCNAQQLFSAYDYEHPSQMAFYLWLYHRAFPTSNGQMEEAHLYHIPDLIKPDCVTRAEVTDVNNRGELYQAVEERISALIEDLLDPQVALTPREDDKQCSFCPFLTLCNKRPKSQ